MKTWKWSTGEAYYKSSRQDIDNAEKIDKPNLENTYDSQLNAIQQSLADDGFFNQDADITTSMFSRNQNTSGTRREEIDSKMSDREMLVQRGVNPFLQTSYVNDIVTRDIFLKPVNTTREKQQENTDNTDNIENTDNK